MSSHEKNTLQPEDQILFELASEFQKNSYSPYSQCRVGAAVQMSDGSFHGGCNIENSSYGATVCAERVAIWKALSFNPNLKIKKIVIIGPTEIAWPPCGMCRQVMSEFAMDQLVVHSATSTGIKKTWSFPHIFPESFAPNYLIKT